MRHTTRRMTTITSSNTPPRNTRTRLSTRTTTTPKSWTLPTRKRFPAPVKAEQTTESLTTEVTLTEMFTTQAYVSTEGVVKDNDPNLVKTFDTIMLIHIASSVCGFLTFVISIACCVSRCNKRKVCRCIDCFMRTFGMRKPPKVRHSPRLERRRERTATRHPFYRFLSSSRDVSECVQLETRLRQSIYADIESLGPNIESLGPDFSQGCREGRDYAYYTSDESDDECNACAALNASAGGKYFCCKKPIHNSSNEGDFEDCAHETDETAC